jgi:hypothetical protein
VRSQTYGCTTCRWADTARVQPWTAPRGGRGDARPRTSPYSRHAQAKGRSLRESLRALRQSAYLAVHCLCSSVGPNQTVVFPGYLSGHPACKLTSIHMRLFGRLNPLTAATGLHAPPPYERPPLLPRVTLTPGVSRAAGPPAGDAGGSAGPVRLPGRHSALRWWVV